MQFKISRKNISLENSIGKEIQMEFSEGVRTGVLTKTNSPSHPFVFNFEKMGIPKRLYFNQKDLTLNQKRIKYSSNFYALENQFDYSRLN